MATRGPGRAIVAAIASWWFPGLGPGAVRRDGAMYLWIVATAVITVAIALSIWFVAVLVALRLAALIHAFRVVRAGDRAGVATSWIGIATAIGVNLAVPFAIRGIAVEAFKTPSTSMAPTLTIGDHLFIDKLTTRLRGVQRGEVIVFRQPCEPDRDYVKRVIALAGETVEVRCNVAYVNGKALPEELVQGAGCRYADQNDPDQDWRQIACSEYREATGDHRYHIYHDEGRPAREAKREAIAYPDPHDFPRLEEPHRPPSCGAESLRVTSIHQAPGSIVETRPGAGPCELQLHYVVPADHVFVLGDNRSNSNDSRYWGSVPLETIKGRVVGIWFSAGASGASLARFGRID